MKKTTCRAAAALTAFLGTLTTSSATNVAGSAFGGTAIIGVNDSAVFTDLGTPRSMNVTVAAPVAAPTTVINNANNADAIPSSTIFPTNTDGLSYVGIRWAVTRTDYVKTLTLRLACYGDGGWFGFNGSAPALGGALSSATHLVEPSVQVTTNGGTTWNTVASTSNYLTQFDAFVIGASDILSTPQEFLITLTTPQTNINGIRVIGQNGGRNNAKDPNGFISVIELGVDAGAATDSDADGIDDTYEASHGMNVGVNDSAGDVDTDGRTNLQEFVDGTNPQDADTDDDGLNDGPEVTATTNPFIADTDGDGLTDGAEVNTHLTNPKVLDTDGDLLADNVEINTHGTNPTVADSDGDTFTDGQEIARGTLPLIAASRPSNIAITGSAIVGLKAAIDSADVVNYSQDGTTPGILNRLIDENLTTRIQTFHGTSLDTYSFVGVKWPVARTSPIIHVEMKMALFGDGGWWGRTNNAPGGGVPLGAGNVPAAGEDPIVQVTTTGDPTWQTTPSVTNCSLASGELGQPTGGGLFINPTVSKTIYFNLTSPPANVTGVRVIGREGGTGGPAFPLNPTGQGFLGCFELVVRDATSSADRDGDGATDAQEAIALSDPDIPDTDNDEVLDGAEINTLLSSPTDVDSDDDGFLDGVEVKLLTNPASAASRPPSIARGGIGVTGINDLVDADNGTFVANSQTPAASAPVFAFTNLTTSNNPIDGIFTTRVDTFNALVAFSYAGVRWFNPWPRPISRVDVTHATFFDGGWFGVNSVGPGSNGLLTAAHIDAANQPTIQTTVDGFTWDPLPGGTTITTDFVAKMIGHRIGNNNVVAPGAVNPTRAPKFTLLLSTPIPGNTIRGIRVIGREGGTASGGFVGFLELAVQDDISLGSDPDFDGLNAAAEALAGSNPESEDTDGDGVMDFAEVNTFGSNPNNADSDNDRFTDGVEVANGTNPASAVSYPQIVTRLTTGITGLMGTNNAIDSDAGTAFVQGGQSVAALVDGLLTTRTDNFNGGGLDPVSFMGIQFATPQTVKSVTITFATFGDGGWFGFNDIIPSTGVALSSVAPNVHLVEPTVQVSTDNGVTWVTTPHTSNYLSSLNGLALGGSRAATFTLNNAATGVNRVRVIGTEGGTASHGFLGAFEVAATTGGPAGDIDNDGLSDAWEVANFGYAHLQHPKGDPENDGSDNLLEYAFNMNPNAADSPPRPVLEGGYLTMTITKQPGVTYSVQSGATLADFGTVTTTVLINNATTLKVRDNVLISSPDVHRFMKTVVTAP